MNRLTTKSIKTATRELITLSVAVLLGIAIFSSKEAPTTSAASTHATASEDSSGDDIGTLDMFRQMFIQRGDVIEGGFSILNKSLDLTLNNLNPLKADTIAGKLCELGSRGLVKDKDWKVRVYLSNGSLANQCRIK
jgi:hypothetical protein